MSRFASCMAAAAAVGVCMCGWMWGIHCKALWVVGRLQKRYINTVHFTIYILFALTLSRKHLVDSCVWPLLIFHLGMSRSDLKDSVSGWWRHFFLLICIGYIEHEPKPDPSFYVSCHTCRKRRAQFVAGGRSTICGRTWLNYLQCGKLTIKAGISICRMRASHSVDYLYGRSSNPLRTWWMHRSDDLSCLYLAKGSDVGQVVRHSSPEVTLRALVGVVRT